MCWWAAVDASSRISEMSSDAPGDSRSFGMLYTWTYSLSWVVLHNMRSCNGKERAWRHLRLSLGDIAYFFVFAFLVL